MPPRTLALGLALAALAGCGGGVGGVGPSGPDVIEVARANDLDAFVQAVEAAGLEQTLSDAAFVTLFAPTDRAFALGGPLPADRGALRGLIGYHVVPGQLTSDFMTGMQMNHSTSAGRPLTVDGRRGLTAGGANVIRRDIPASNGVVHVIDRVLDPA